MVLKKVSLFILFFAFWLCSFSQEKKTLDFPAFSVEIPADWEGHGISESDSTAFVLTAGTDTMVYDTSYRHSWFRPIELIELDTLSEYTIPDDVDTTFKKLLLEANQKTAQNNAIIKTKNQHWKRANELLRNTYPFSFSHNFADVEREKYKAVLITPDEEGRTTGVYIELHGEGKNVFYLRGKDLSPITANEVLDVAKTVKIKE